jgi:hypothetical protein
VNHEKRQMKLYMIPVPSTALPSRRFAAQQTRDSRPAGFHSSQILDVSWFFISPQPPISYQKSAFEQGMDMRNHTQVEGAWHNTLFLPPLDHFGPSHTQQKTYLQTTYSFGRGSHRSSKNVGGAFLRQSFVPFDEGKRR